MSAEAVGYSARKSVERAVRTGRLPASALESRALSRDIRFFESVWKGGLIRLPGMNEIIFEVREDEIDGGYPASALGVGIHAEADTQGSLRANVREAVDCYYDERMAAPKVIRLHFVHDEVLARCNCPRQVSGPELVQALHKVGFESTRQRGSHVRVKTQKRGEHHEAIPSHHPIKAGTH